MGFGKKVENPKIADPWVTCQKQKVLFQPLKFGQNNFFDEGEPPTTAPRIHEKHI